MKMNDWAWQNVGKPMWLVLKRRGLNKDLRNLFMKRYSGLMNECLLARHTQLLEKAIAPMDRHHISTGTLMTLLADLHYEPCIVVIAAIKHQKVERALEIYPSWLDPERTWQRKQEYAYRVLPADEYQNNQKWEVL